MDLNYIEKTFEEIDLDPLPRLCAATERLRQFAASETARFNLEQRRLIEETLSVAVQSEQALAVQRARIRYLEGLSITDQLTGLLNRRGFLAELDRALARARRNGETGLLLLCDLDHFKEINDTHGHVAGDAVLCAVAGCLQSNTRRTDYVGRLGGDEFAVLMTHSTSIQAERRVRYLATLINSLVVDWNGHGIGTSASFGSEGYHRNSQAETLLFLADRALYRHKGPRLVTAVPSPS